MIEPLFNYLTVTLGFGWAEVYDRDGQASRITGVYFPLRFSFIENFARDPFHVTREDF